MEHTILLLDHSEIPNRVLLDASEAVKGFDATTLFVNNVVIAESNEDGAIDEEVLLDIAASLSTALCEPVAYCKVDANGFAKHYNPDAPTGESEDLNFDGYSNLDIFEYASTLPNDRFSSKFGV